MIQVRFYTRKACHLCEEVHKDLISLQSEVPHNLQVIDVDSDPEMTREYDLVIPVVEVGPYRLKSPFSAQELRVTLRAAADREKHIERIDTAAVEGGSSQSWTKTDAFTHWFSRHYLAFLNTLVLIYVGLPFLAPALVKINIPAPAQMIYRGYSLVCHQLAFRSIFLFGEQWFYPRQAAGVEGLLSFHQATGLSEASTAEALYAARNFIGNEVVGYKVALCQRDVAIYGAILLFGLLYPLVKDRLPDLPWYLWIMLGIVPVGLDGLSQLISQPPFNFGVFRESTPLLRLLSGGLFGFATAWFGYPMVDETMKDARQIMEAKLERVKRLQQKEMNKP